MSGEHHIPAWQQMIVDKRCPEADVWENFAESEYESSIPARFEFIAARFPDRSAVVDDQQSLTYAELNAAANRVAHGLLGKLGVGSEPVVHLFEHCAEAVVAVLGILKAGKFYVPLDRYSPPEHLRTIVTAAGSRLILTDLSSKGIALSATDERIEVSSMTDIADDACHNPNVAVAADDYLYVVFTSGSTGKPKGVIENHRNALHVAANYIHTIRICVEDRHCLSNRLNFSGSKSTMFGALLNGSTLFLYDIHRRGIQSFPDWIARNGMTVLTLTPPVFRLLADVVGDSGNLASVRLLWMGGDRVLPSDLETFWRLSSDTSLVYLGYGATEAKLVSHMVYDRRSASGITEMSPGWPISEVDVLIVDENDKRFAPGGVGEIVVHSRFVSPGYWREPELTRQKFQPDPENNGVFFYYTGDLGRLGDDGRLYHMGRVDSQVKIRGQRVELGEIERALLDMEEVSESIAAVRGRTIPEQRLLTWLVWKDSTQPLTISELRRRLVKRLPAYMIPANFLIVEQMPLNANGKIDRHSLPDPDSSRPSLENVNTPPQTPLELEIAQVWADVLAIDGIGIHDNFFELGGNSLQAMRIVALIQRIYGTDIATAKLLCASTVAEMVIVVLTQMAADTDLERRL